METTAVITCMTDSDLPFVGDAVRSAIHQTVPCKILLVVNESSSSQDLNFDNYCSQIRVHRLPLQPVGVIRNIAVAEADTDWIAFLDADDIWMPEKNERQLKFAQTTSRDAIGCRHVLVREDGIPFLYAPAKNMPMPSSMMIRRQLLLAEPFSDIPQWEDAELWKRLDAKSRTAIILDFLVYYRIRRVSSSSNWSPAKRRKLLFARAASAPFLRFPLLIASRFYARISTPRAT